MKRFFKKNAESLDDEIFIIKKDSEENITKPKYQTVPQHVLTPQEVISGFESEKNTNLKNTGALDSLKKRMTNGTSNESKTDNSEPDKPLNNTLYADVFPKKEIQTKPIIENQSNPIEKTFKKEDVQPIVAKPENEEKRELSLLDKCIAYTKDENGKETELNSQPLYKLQSVAEIIQSDRKKTLENLSAKYDISFDNLGYSTEIPNDNSKVYTNEAVENQISETEPETTSVEEVFEEKITFKNVQSNVKSIISDIDMQSEIKETASSKNLNNTATITFTPVNDGKANTTHLSVSSRTRPIDLTGELIKFPESTPEPEAVQLEKNEFEDYVPVEELDCQKNAGKIIRKFAIKSRNSFLITILSFLLTILLALTKLPLMSELILSHTKVAMIICAAITGLIIIINGKMFISLKSIFKRRSNPDVCAALASLTTIAYAILGIITNNIINDFLLLLGIILSFRALMIYLKTSYMLLNMRMLRTKAPKTAVRLIEDNAVTFAMSKNSIEGDVLIAAPQKAENISDFMKYSTFSTFLGGKLPVLNVISIILSIILGFTCSFYFDGIFYGLYAAAAVQYFTAFPVVFFIDVLPLYHANKKLKSKGGMIAGKTGADHIEMANAAVIEAADLFPAGKITLHQMQVLADNNLEDTLVRAASLTESLNSSLAPIFKEIAGTGNITALPDSDTVKYEDRMGISGWVDNRLLFIGNRTLMEAHGIEVPSVEVDRKILRQGFFPVYVATREKACALLIIQYSVDRQIARELRKLTALGVTLLVNSCDPNLIEEMICDYFGLYSDSVKVMSAAGSHMYKNAVAPIKSVSAPAVYRSNPLALTSILNCASKIKKSNLILTVIYIITSILGAVIFAYSSLGGSGNLISETTLLLYGLISTVVSYIIYFFAKP